jgi:aminoglycoside phosphotransferase (APT) family kinase protein
LGRPGFVMERVDGPDLLTRLEKKPWTLWSAGRTCGEVQASLHDVQAPPLLMTTHTRMLAAAMTPLVPPELGVWMHHRLQHLPDGDRLCHGDFHPANVLASSRGPVVIDWANTTRGAPEADVARTLLMLNMGALPPGTPMYMHVVAGIGRRFVRMAYVRAYRRARGVDMALVRRWLPLRAVDRLAENIPGEREALLAMIAKAQASDR